MPAMVFFRLDFKCAIVLIFYVIVLVSRFLLVRGKE